MRPTVTGGGRSILAFANQTEQDYVTLVEVAKSGCIHALIERES